MTQSDTERIVREVLEAHKIGKILGGGNGFECKCGQSCKNNFFHRDHLAEVIAEMLEAEK